MGRAHSNAWLKVGKFFDMPVEPEMHTVCGRSEPSTKAFAEQFGWQNASTDWEAVIADPEVGIIDVGTPGDTHAPISIAAARAGKHVLCEKPLANSVGEAKQMLAAVREAGVCHMVNFNYRRMPAVSLAQQMIAAGEIGEVRHVRAVYLQDWLVDPQFPMSWRMHKSIAGTGAHGDLNAHLIDLARFLTGDEITDVVGDMKTFITERPEADGSGVGQVTVDDAATFLARFAGGAMGTFEATRMAPGRKNYNYIEISGSTGSVYWKLEEPNELHYFSTEDLNGRQGFRKILATESEHPYVAAWWPPGHMLGYEHGFVHGVYDFCTAIASGKGVTPDFKDGAQCVAVLEAVGNSVESNGWQSVEIIS